MLIMMTKTEKGRTALLPPMVPPAAITHFPLPNYPINSTLSVSIYQTGIMSRMSSCQVLKSISFFSHLIVSTVRIKPYIKISDLSRVRNKYMYVPDEKDLEMGMNISRLNFHARWKKGLYDKDSGLMTYLNQAKHLRLTPHTRRELGYLHGVICTALVPGPKAKWDSLIIYEGDLCVVCHA